MGLSSHIRLLKDDPRSSLRCSVETDTTHGDQMDLDDLIYRTHHSVKYGIGFRLCLGYERDPGWILTLGKFSVSLSQSRDQNSHNIEQRL